MLKYILSLAVASTILSCSGLPLLSSSEDCLPIDDPVRIIDCQENPEELERYCEKLDREFNFEEEFDLDNGYIHHKQENPHRKQVILYVTEIVLQSCSGECLDHYPGYDRLEYQVDVQREDGTKQVGCKIEKIIGVKEL